MLKSTALFCLGGLFLPLPSGAETLQYQDRQWSREAIRAAPPGVNPYQMRRRAMRAQELENATAPVASEASAPARPAPVKLAEPRPTMKIVIPNIQAAAQARAPARPAAPAPRPLRLAFTPLPKTLPRIAIASLPVAQPAVIEAAAVKLAALAPAAGEGVTAPLIAVPAKPDADAPAKKQITPLLDTPAVTPAVPPSPVTPAPSAVPSVAEPAAPQIAAPAEALEKSLSEPPQDLSKQSESLLKKIPSNLDAQKVPSGQIDIDRAKDTKELFAAEAPSVATARHEATGISIEIKKQEANINYELDKAYNALIAGNSEDAIAIYKNVLANDGRNKNALFGLATTYHRAGQLDIARPLYGRLLAIDPTHRDALNNFLVLVADEAPQAALAELERLEARNPDFSPIPAQMAVIYQKLGDLDKANEKMFRAVQLAPENLTYRYNLAIMMDKQRNYDEAAKLYRQVLEAYMRGAAIPGNAQKIQERLTFISSNRR